MSCSHIIHVRIGIVLVAFAAVAPACAQDRAKPTPTQADFQYGPHERNVFDFWQAKSDGPTPVAIYIHGGGFRGGKKETIGGDVLMRLLDAGISVAAFNYRFVKHAPLPAAHHDCRRALQVLRSKADEWHIDRDCIGAYGGSAGAQLCMYLAFHDEMACPDSEDPVERESTRLSCVATLGGQTTMDVEWWLAHIPEYDKPHRDFYEFFGASDREEYLQRVADVSALSLISQDDPPIYMLYAMRPDEPAPEGERAEGWKIHHVQFGLALQEKMDELGLESHLVYPGEMETMYDGLTAFLVAELTAKSGD